MRVDSGDEEGKERQEDDDDSGFVFEPVSANQLV
jgi:hypothetical protein